MYCFEPITMISHVHDEYVLVIRSLKQSFGYTAINGREIISEIYFEVQLTKVNGVNEISMAFKICKDF